MSDPIAESHALDGAARTPLSNSALAWCGARRHALVVWSAMAAWSGVLFATARSEYVNFRLGRFDFGNMVQAIWSTAQGRPLQVTNVSGDEVSRLSIHIDPVLALFAPFWAALPSPETVLLVRIVAVSLGALPVFWIARRHLASEGIASLLALAYLAYPWLAWTALEPHPVTLAIPLLLYCVWALDADRLVAFVPFAALAALTGELVGLTLALIGLWYAFSRGRRRAGLVIALLGIGWSLFAVYVVVPAFSGSGSAYYGYFVGVGGSPQGVVRTLFTHPGAIASALFTGRDVLYVLALALPLGGLFVLAPGLAAAALPQLLQNGLAGPTAMTDPRQHYSAVVIPIAISATVLGIAGLSVRRQALAAKVVFGLCLGLSVVVGAWPGVPGKVPAWDAVDFSPAHVDALRAAVGLVPDNAAVSSTNKAGSHLSARRYYYSVPVLGRADWIVLDTQDPFVETPVFPVLAKSPLTLERFTRRIQRDPRWRRVYDEEGVLVFRRVRSS